MAKVIIYCIFNKWTALQLYRNLYLMTAVTTEMGRNFYIKVKIAKSN